MRHPWNSQAFSRGAQQAGRDSNVIQTALSCAATIKRANSDLPVIFTLRHLAHLTDTPYSKLRVFVSRQEDPYRIFLVKKRSTSRGSSSSRRYRTICAPEPDLKRVQRWIAQNVLNCINVHPASFAYAPGSDLVRAAVCHCPCRWLVKIDLQRFFESIPERHAYQVFRDLGYPSLLSFELARICTRFDQKVSSQKSPFYRPDDSGIPLYASNWMGWLPQGAPTSPMLANLAVRSLDNRLEALSTETGWTYSRYADDLAFSTTEEAGRAGCKALVRRVETEIKAFGLEPNRQKTHIVPPGARKVLLGLLIGDDRPRLTRDFRNNLETHIYALTSPKIGPLAHLKRRGFESIIGMRRHIHGLLTFAAHVDPGYANSLVTEFRKVTWPV